MEKEHTGCLRMIAFILGLLLLIIGVFLCIAILSPSGDDNEEVQKKYNKAYNITYVVSGTASSANVTFINEDGGISQRSFVNIPWEYSFKAHSNTALSITAQNNGKYGTVIVKIYSNYSLLKQSKSVGEYCVASVDVYLP